MREDQSVNSEKPYSFAKPLCLLLLVAIVVALLGGCATGPRRPPAPPAIVFRTIEVDRPTPVPCVDRSKIPAMPPKVGDQLNGKARHDEGILAQSAIDLRDALDAALSLLGACVAPPAP